MPKLWSLLKEKKFIHYILYNEGEIKQFSAHLKAIFISISVNCLSTVLLLFFEYECVCLFKWLLKSCCILYIHNLSFIITLFSPCNGLKFFMVPFRCFFLLKNRSNTLILRMGTTKVNFSMMVVKSIRNMNIFIFPVFNEVTKVQSKLLNSMP